MIVRHIQNGIKIVAETEYERGILELLGGVKPFKPRVRLWQPCNGLTELILEIDEMLVMK